MTSNTGTDGRRPGWYWIDNEFLTTYGAEAGVYGIAVYNVLAMHGNRDRESWPSVNRIAELIGASPNAVRAALKRLEAMGLVKIDNRQVDGVFLSNHYELVHIDAGGTAPREVLLHQVKGVLHHVQGGTAPGEGGTAPREEEQDSENKTQRTRPSEPDSFTQGLDYVDQPVEPEQPTETEFDRLFKANLIQVVQERWPSLRGGFTFESSTLLLLRQIEKGGPLLTAKAIDWALDRWEDTKEEAFNPAKTGSVNWLLTTVQDYRPSGARQSAPARNGKSAALARPAGERYVPTGIKPLV